MVTPVIRVEDIISINVFSCSLYSSLPTTPSKPASNGGGDIRYWWFWWYSDGGGGDKGVVMVAFEIRSSLPNVLHISGWELGWCLVDPLVTCWQGQSTIVGRRSKCPTFYTTMISVEKECTPKRAYISSYWHYIKFLFFLNYTLKYKIIKTLLPWNYNIKTQKYLLTFISSTFTEKESENMIKQTIYDKTEYVWAKQI